MDWNFIIFPLMILSLVLLYGNSKWGIPSLSVINNWLRWVFLAFSFAYLSREFELFDKSFLTLLLCGFLAWFILETLYHWLTIRVLNYSSIPLFPRFSTFHGGDQWPNQPKLLALRNYLRQHKFTQATTLKASLVEGLSLISAIYFDKHQTTRLQILFLPSRARTLTTYFTLTSITQDGSRIITDNVNMPFGGFYPHNWSLSRHPLTTSLHKLYKLHTAHCQNFTASSLQPFDPQTLLQDINTQQSTLERTNRDHGFLLPTQFEDSHGQLTLEGRYRIWLEIWRLKYLGSPLTPQYCLD